MVNTFFVLYKKILKDEWVSSSMVNIDLLERNQSKRN